MDKKDKDVQMIDISSDNEDDNDVIIEDVIEAPTVNKDSKKKIHNKNLPTPTPVTASHASKTTNLE
jgi:hypothetical protein